MAKLRGGGPQPPQFTGSMAAAIEAQLNDMLTEKLPGEDTQEARDRRRFFAAVARGVIKHLLDNPDALQVVFTAVPAPHVIADFKAQVQVNADDVT
jgi:hypothetical protein